ncbi:hypothetical protein OG226_01245 [Streptomyces sp. NBC_01261]|uniref:hypothetical protein n=1 Tax=Streptomyces sp. NBC_01261 TaxID=2903802 RepID=UPI002E35775D|nr:hypothetical protein [Streptomyces sp. NBC_01261]
MQIAPVITTLIGAGFGSLSTTIVAVVVQRVTRQREREHKLWERQVAVIEESLKYERPVAQARRDAMRSPDSDVMDSMAKAVDGADVAKIQANLELYGSLTMKDAHQAAFETFRDWFVEFIQWQHWNKRTGPGHEEQERAEAVRETTKRWPNVEKLSAKADEAYDELVKVMRATAIFEPVVSRVTRGANQELPR